MSFVTRDPLRAKARLTACLIAQDEQEHLPQALASLRFCDEIVVVDGGSTDHTADIARAAGATVIENRWPGFAAQRNLALDNATGDWVLEIDADERVSPQLQASIEQLLETPEPGAEIAVCALRNRFLGGQLGPSAKYPAYRSRLFRRGAYRHDESRHVHEGIEPRERPIVLEGDLEHELAGTLREALSDMWHYAHLESTHLDRTRSPFFYLKAVVLRPMAKLAYRATVEHGLRDGWRGMLKIGLDAISDVLVWLLVLCGAGGGQSQTDELFTDHEQKHFGRRPAGPPKVIALAAGNRDSEAAVAWLSALRAHAIDVTLVSDTENCEGDIPTREVVKLRPFATMRALDIEMQLRTAHAVVPVGRRARLVNRMLPRTLRPVIRGLDACVDPAQAALLAQAAVEGH